MTGQPTGRSAAPSGYRLGGVALLLFALILPGKRDDLWAFSSMLYRNKARRGAFPDGTGHRRSRSRLQATAAPGWEQEPPTP